jgi:predicted nucleic acid-binding Zn ribbon protein
MKPGAALAALRRRTWHLCAVCGKRFSGIAKAIYCSNACRQKAKYARSRKAGAQDD